MPRAHALMNSGGEKKWPTKAQWDRVHAHRPPLGCPTWPAALLVFICGEGRKSGVQEKRGTGKRGGETAPAPINPDGS